GGSGNGPPPKPAPPKVSLLTLESWQVNGPSEDALRLLRLNEDDSPSTGDSSVFETALAVTIGNIRSGDFHGGGGGICFSCPFKYVYRHFNVGGQVCVVYC